MEDNKLRNQRIENLNNIKSLGINPYPYVFNQKNHAKEILEKYGILEKEEKTKDQVSVAGRVMTLRQMGKASFGHVQDASGKIQFYIREDHVGEKTYNLFKNFDLGDIIGVEGTIFRTKMGEVSIWVDKVELLCKSLLPLPEKFHGLKDTEIRYRQRYLDMIMNPEVVDVFRKRASIIEEMRSFLRSRGFVESEIPTLQNVYGGAAAHPFIAHLNALNIDIYLQISPELYLKRLIVGGMEKVFFIGKSFRNEDIDRTHNPEFTMMECYDAYTDYNTVMKLTEEMIESICKKVNGSTKVSYGEVILDFKAPWQRLTMFEAIKKFGKLDIEKMTDSELKSEIKNNNLEVGSRDEMINSLFEALAESKLIQPTFITDYPLSISPLTKVHRKNPKLVERFEAFINGTELANAYSELNDAIEQESRFKMQEKMKEEGNEETHPKDADFIKALEYGMPPCGGLGVGVDRLVMFLTNQHSIRDVLPFPFMKPESLEESKVGKSKETKMAVAIINKGLNLKKWEELNTVAHLNAAFGARVGKSLFMQDKIETKDNKEINLNIQHAIMIKELNSNKEIVNLIVKAKDKGLEVSEFTREMISTTDDKKVASITKNKNLEEIEYLGVLVFGKKSEVDSLTRDFKLYQ